MTTSLAQQLQRLAVPQTSSLQRDKKRPSLLFDPKDAATLTRETVYQIGLEGFEELKKKNRLFSQFENTLFHVTSKEFERSVQDAGANEKLDRAINKFFLLLSPYFLLNSAHKALEWLINRFSVHEYNKNEFLMLILPYHETNIFVRALQVVQIKESNENWMWLKPLQKPGIHLPKQTLFNHAAHDSYFLHRLSTFVLSAVKEHENPSLLSVLFNFYCMTFTGALDILENIDETQVSQILNALLKGSKSKVADFCAGTYIIIAKLLSKTELSDKLLNKFVSNVAEIQIPSLKTEAVLLLVIIYQTQKQFVDIPDKAIRKLATKAWIPKLLQELSTANNFITPLLERLFKGSIKLALLETESTVFKCFVDGLLNEIKFENSFIPNVINVLVDSYDPRQKYSQDTREWMKEFLNNIEKQYPVAFDKEVNQMLKTTRGEKLTKRQKCLQKFLTTNLFIQGHVVPLEQLYHPVARVRKHTMKFVSKKFDSLSDREKEFFTNSIMDRLNDENCDVVCETLNQSKKILSKILNVNDLMNILFHLLLKCTTFKDKWWQVSHPALSILCKVAPENDTAVFLNILPFLLPTDQNELITSKVIVDSAYLSKCEFLKPLEQQLKNAATCEKFFAIVFDGLSMNSKNPDIKSLINSLKEYSQKNKTTLCKYISSLLLCSSLPENCSPVISSMVLDVLISHLNSSKLKCAKGEQTVSNYIIMARKNKFPLQGFLHCMETLILKTQVPNVRLGLNDFSIDNEVSNFYSLVLTILLRGCYLDKGETSTLYAESLKKFFEHCFVDFKSKIEFLLNITVATSKFVIPLLQLRSLRTVNTLLSKKQENLSSFVNLNEICVPYLLVCLLSTHKEIRLAAIDTIRILLSILGSRGDNYILILENLVKNKENIILDHNEVAVTILNVLGPNVVKGNKNEKVFKSIMNALIDMTFDEKYPVYLRAGVTDLLSQINEVEVSNKISRFGIEILEENKNVKCVLDTQKSIVIYNNIKRFNIHVASKLQINSNIFNFLSLALRNDVSTVKCGFDLTSQPAILAMDQIDRDLFEGLQDDVKLALLNIVIEVAATTQNPEVSATAGRIFKHVDLDSKLVTEQLKKMRDVRSPKIDATKRKRRVSTIPTVDILDTLDWKKGVTILEFIQDKKKIKNTSALLPILFEILKKCLDFDEQGSVEYAKQLILSSILNSCGKIKDEELPENAFNMELVVQCIRASQNPQTHHHALLVLAQTANLIPTQVLHNIMAIFTFMGSSVLRHDDAYSFQIINKIIDTIIPILVEDNGKENVTCVLRVFVDAVMDVPEHRRIPLYTNLLKQIGAKDNLYCFLLLMFEGHVLHSNADKQKSKLAMTNIKDIGAPRRLDIAADLSRQFPPDVVILTCIKLLEYLRTLPEDKDEFMETNAIQFFDINHHTPKQFRHYKYVTVTFITNLLSSKEFVNQIAVIPDENLLALEPLYKDAIVNVLTYIQTVVKISEKNMNTPQAQYWKVILHHSYDILDSVNALLTPQMFLLVIRGLTTHNLNPVQRRALELLNSKLQYDSTFFSNTDDSELFAVIPSLIKIIKQMESNQVDSEQELIIQTALLSLKLFVKLLGKKHPEKFATILEFITNIVKSGQAQGNILASSVLCLAELCNNLRAFAISSLSKFMPSIIKLLKLHRQQESSDLLLLSVLTAIQKIVDNLSLFLSPYLEKLLCELATVASKSNLNTEDPKITPIVSKLTAINQKIGSSIPARVLIPIIDRSYKALISKNKFSSIGPLMEILAENLSNLQSSEIQVNLPELTKFFLNALQFRACVVTSHVDTNEIESHTLKALVTLILKLSESTFRPLYYKIYDWAVRSDEVNERVITFYSLSSQVANSLKGLFVLFAGHFLNNAATLLDTCNIVKSKKLYFDGDDKNIMLVENILKTLHAVCLYDTQKFISKERFDVLMQPIVDQLENTLGGEESLVGRASATIIPCIVQFAVATGDDALWKQLNYQVLLKMRHGSPSIRLIALNCLMEVAKKLGDDFLPLVPETIPFLAELLEDEEENIEKGCQKAIQELEKVVGEPLQKYF